VRPRLAPLRQPARRRHQSSAPPDERRSVRARAAVRPIRHDTAPRPPAPPPTLDDEGTPLRDRGVTLLGTVTAAMLTIVALAWLVAVVGRWWILAPVMAVALALTAIVLVVMIRLLDDDG
jgi:hypothetical protein